MFGQINIEDELLKEKEKNSNILEQVRKWLLDEEMIEEKIFESHEERNDIDAASFDQDRVFDKNTIKNICIKYKLRFLDRKRFNGKIPYEAILEIKRIAKEKEIDLKKFKILAPSKKFDLEDENSDPLLMAELFADTYYLVYKWGNDLAWYKKILAFPLRSFRSLLTSIFSIAFAISMIVPTQWLSIYENTGYFNFYRFVLFFWSFILMGSICIYFFFLLRKDFSENVWNSKYIQ